MMLRARLAVAGALLVAAAPLAAQSAPTKPPASPPGAAPKAAKPAMDHGGMDHAAMHGQPAKPTSGKPEENHAASGWKELDAYHEFMMATWHPAKGKNDLAPLRAKAADMLASANALAKSTPPKACDSPEVRSAVSALPLIAKEVELGVRKGMPDEQLKSTLEAGHRFFEKAEAGCAAPGKKHH